MSSFAEKKLPEGLVSWIGSGFSWLMGDSDGVTDKKRNASIGWDNGFHAAVGSEKVSHGADKDHEMRSGQSLAWDAGTASYTRTSGGKIVTDDGAKIADQKSTKLSVSNDGATLGRHSETSRKQGDDSSSTSMDWLFGWMGDSPTARLASERQQSDGTTTTGTKAQAGWGEKGGYGSWENSRKIYVDDDNVLTSKQKFEVNKDEVSISTSSGSRLKDPELTGVVDAEDKSTRVGYGKKGVTVNQSRKESTEVGDEKFSRESSRGWDGDQATWGSSRSHEKKDENGNTVTNSSGTQIGGNLDGGSISNTRSTSIVDKDDKVVGSKSSTVGGDVDLKNKTVGANYGHESVDEKGNKTGYGAAGKVGVDDSGALKSAEGSFSVSRNGATASVHGGFHVDAEKPVEVNGGFVVAWSKTSEAGAAGKYGKVGAHAGTNSVEHGRRVFKSQAEAELFVKNAASMIPVDQPEPTTVDGALRLQVGESRGRAHGSDMGVEGSMSIGSVGGVNAGANKSSSDGTSVERVSESVFLVTVDNAAQSGWNFGVSLSSASVGKSSSDSKSGAVTVQFDLSTSEGKKAFEEFHRSHKLPKKGGEVISQTEAKQHREGTAFKIGSLGSASITSTTSESVTYDKRGKTETYEGEFGWEVDEIDLPFLDGDGDIKSASRIVETELNDKQRAHVLNLFVACQDGDDSRRELAKLTGMGDYDNGPEKSSGKWSVSAQISDEQMQYFMKRFEGNKERAEDIFGGGTDARNQLTKQLHAAKSMDDKMRAVASFIANDKLSRQNLGDLRNVLFGEVWGGADANFQYDLLLKDEKGKIDRNFQGVGGRVELEGKIEKYQGLMQSGGSAGKAPLFDSLDAEVRDLQRRKAEISDPKRYTDLPSELRRQQLMQIDGYLEAFVSMRRQSGMEASKLRPGEEYNSEEDGKVVAGDAEDSKMDPRLRETRRVRSEISRSDFRIDFAKGSYDEGTQELQGLLRDPNWVLSNRTVAKQYEQKLEKARRIVASAAPMLAQIDEARALFLRNAGDPNAAAPLAANLAAQLKIVQSLYEQAQLDVDTMLGQIDEAAESPVASDAPAERRDGIMVGGKWYESWAAYHSGKSGPQAKEEARSSVPMHLPS